MSPPALPTRVRVTLYETAREASFVEMIPPLEPETRSHTRPGSPASPARRPPATTPSAETDAAGLHGGGERRARGAVRRYAVANRLTRLLTVTRADQTHEPRVMLRSLAQFQRRLRERYPDLVWERVLERHKSGAVHAHYLLSRRLEHRDVARLWPHGFVWLSPKVRTKNGGHEDARLASRYLTKYVLKDPVRDGLGGHRYEVRQGHRPGRLRFWADNPDEAVALASAVVGYTQPRYQWTSSGEPDWAGPPAGFLSW